MESKKHDLAIYFIPNLVYFSSAHYQKHFKELELVKSVGKKSYLVLSKYIVK